jgi:hypothetical protein
MQLSRTVEELDETVDSEALTKWMAYANLEPFGFPMDNFRMGVPASSLYNAIMATIPIAKGRRRPKQLKPEDFYPQMKGKNPSLTPQIQEHLRKKRAKRKNG